MFGTLFLLIVSPWLYTEKRKERKSERCCLRTCLGELWGCLIGGGREPSFVIRGCFCVFCAILKSSERERERERGGGREEVGVGYLCRNWSTLVNVVVTCCWFSFLPSLSLSLSPFNCISTYARCVYTLWPCEYHVLGQLAGWLAPSTLFKPLTLL